MENWSMPSPTELETILTLMKPFEMVLRPVFYDLDNITDERPLMFVGNHQMYGLDVPFLIAGLYREKNILVRGLGDSVHFKVPFWNRICSHFGVVVATPDNCRALMETGECILEYPGGARESFRGKNQQYEMLWNNRLGFARLALQHRCSIIPVAAIGVDELFGILWDKEDYLNSPLKILIDRFELRRDLLFPVSYPKNIERLRFKFGTPIRMERFAGRTDEETCDTLHDLVRQTIEADIQWLLEKKLSDP